jgi:hypothetical protein
VDGSDFLAWQRGLGVTTGASHAQGDADADGDVDAVDLGVWKSKFGVGAAQQPTADFNRDSAVNGLDLAAWRGGFGAAVGALAAQGDADLDGDVDGADFLQWQRTVGLSGVAATSGADSAGEAPSIPGATIQRESSPSPSMGALEASALAGAIELLAQESPTVRPTWTDQALVAPPSIHAALRDGAFATLTASTPALSNQQDDESNEAFGKAAAGRQDPDVWAEQITSFSWRRVGLS